MLELLLDLTRRALEGFVFAAPCVGIWFLGLRFHKKAPPFAHMLAAFGLCLYLSGVLAVTGIGKPFGFFPRISLVPFVDMELRQCRCERIKTPKSHSRSGLASAAATARTAPEHLLYWLFKASRPLISLTAELHTAVLKTSRRFFKKIASRFSGWQYGWASYRFWVRRNVFSSGEIR